MLPTGGDFVVEIASGEDGGAPTSSAGWVAGLDHEVGDYAVDEVVVVGVAGDEGGEVLDGFGGVVAVHFEDDGALVCY